MLNTLGSNNTHYPDRQNFYTGTAQRVILFIVNGRNIPETYLPPDKHIVSHVKINVIT